MVAVAAAVVPTPTPTSLGAENLRSIVEVVYPSPTLSTVIAETVPAIETVEVNSAETGSFEVSIINASNVNVF